MIIIIISSYHHIISATYHLIIIASHQFDGAYHCSMDVFFKSPPGQLVPSQSFSVPSFSSPPHNLSHSWIRWTISTGHGPRKQVHYWVRHGQCTWSSFDYFSTKMFTLKKLHQKLPSKNVPKFIITVYCTVELLVIDNNNSNAE